MTRGACEAFTGTAKQGGSDCYFIEPAWFELNGKVKTRAAYTVRKEVNKWPFGRSVNYTLSLSLSLSFLLSIIYRSTLLSLLPSIIRMSSLLYVLVASP